MSVGFFSELGDRVAGGPSILAADFAYLADEVKGTAPLVVEAGARVLVAGSAVYRGDPTVEMRKIIEAGRNIPTASPVRLRNG